MTGGGKIGIFDSGLGGLYIARAIREAMPQYDYLYLGDTLHLPYGKRSDGAIYDLCEAAMRFLFAQGCELIVMACNTASAAALRKLQQGFLAREFPERRILGVVVPTLEAAIDHGATKIGLLATQRTVQSGIYEIELKKLNPAVELTAVAAPLLVPLIEDGGEKYLDAVLDDYLGSIVVAGCESVILGCTHYVALKDRLCAKGLSVISQDEIIPGKLADYLMRHPEMQARLLKGGTLTLAATDANKNFQRNAQALLGLDMMLTQANY